MKQLGVCNISDFTSVILKSFLFRHRVRKCISTHNSSHIGTYQDVADVKVQCVCVSVCVWFRGCLALRLPSNTTPSRSGNFERLLERDVGSVCSDGQHTLISGFTAWRAGRWHPQWLALAAAPRHEMWVLPKANNLRPTGFIWAHQVNSCFPEHRQLSFSLCQEPLETLYEDN